jgi:hypothetical protein
LDWFIAGAGSKDESQRRRQVHGSSPHLVAPACDPRARGDPATRRC